MYHRVVIRLLMTPPISPEPDSSIGGTGSGAAIPALGRLRKWQGRKDSNPRPSVLETDALTRLSYAPIRRMGILPEPRIAPSPPDYHRRGAGCGRPSIPDRRRRARRPRAALRSAEAIPRRPLP